MKHRPRKRFGQNFLRDPMVIEQMIEAIAPHAGDHLVEIGPGQGALTGPLLQRCQQLDVIELDRDLAAWLTQHFSASPQLHIHCEDALQTRLSKIAPENEQVRIIGNLPYNISTPLLFHLFGQLAWIQDLHIMLQKEVADRMGADPGSKTYGKLSVMTQYHCQVEPLFEVDPESFNPPPKVTSTVLRLTPHTVPPVTPASFTCFQATVTQAFSQRRKTLRNTLKPLLSEAQITAAGVQPGARAETLGLDDFASLSNLVELADIQ